MKSLFDPNEISQKFQALSRHAKHDNVEQFEVLCRELSHIYVTLCNHFGVIDAECSRLSSETASLRKQVDKMHKTLDSTFEHYRESFAVFEKFRASIELVHKMEDLHALPQMLASMEEFFDLDKVGLVLAFEEFADFLPPDIQTRPYFAIEEVLCRISADHPGRRWFLGRMRDVPNPELLLGEEFTRGNPAMNRGSCFIYPLRNRYNPARSIGAITLFDADPLRYQPDMGTDFLEHFCEVFAAAVVTARNQEKLNRENTVDPLTGVHNRLYLHRHAPRILDFAERKGFPVSALFIDLNNFKTINDTLGHNVGDRVLSEVAGRLNKVVRKYDIFVRWGGDEFVVLTPGPDEAEIENLVVRMKEDVASLSLADLCGQESEAGISVSVGTAYHKPGQSIEELIRQADEKMYQDKLVRN